MARCLWISVHIPSFILFWIHVSARPLVFTFLDEELLGQRWQVSKVCARSSKSLSRGRQACAPCTLGWLPPEADTGVQCAFLWIMGCMFSCGSDGSYFLIGGPTLLRFLVRLFWGLNVFFHFWLIVCPLHSNDTCDIFSMNRFS